ncbi:MAG TPA: MipA/OmpV family protein [Cellvibrio sp.]|nr:MipA/OmpV family protein [Cellvibrio sp.]
MSALLAGPALACNPDTEDCVEVGTWDVSLGIGAGVRTNPVEATPDIPLVLIPEVHYTGERFFIQNLDVGYTLWENPVHQLNLFATPSYDQVYFHRWSPSNFFIDASGFATTNKALVDEESVPVIEGDGDKAFIAPQASALQEPKARDRHTAGLGGFEYNFSAGFIDFQIQYVSDFTRVHQGDEARVALAKYWESGRHHLFTSVGAIWQSSEVINYYYGVTAAEADWRGPYSTDAALTPEARLDWNFQLTERWDLRLLATYRQLPDEISASPLINDNKVITVFMGGVYHF